MTHSSKSDENMKLQHDVISSMRCNQDAPAYVTISEKHQLTAKLYILVFDAALYDTSLDRKIIRQNMTILSTCRHRISSERKALAKHYHTCVKY